MINSRFTKVEKNLIVKGILKVVILRDLAVTAYLWPYIRLV